MARLGLSKANGWSRWSRAAPAHARAPVGGALKRAGDIFFASLALAFAAPLMAVVALLVFLCDRRSPFYGHERIGYGGRPFRCWKFRTMACDADARLAAFFAAHPDQARIWAETFKLQHDPRVTWLGGALRRSSLDELPQIVNVLLGQMSCVGPRPIVAQELSKYGASARDYLRARPGITGMWQVGGRSRASYAERVALDVEYVRTWSHGLDLKIIVKTIPAVLDFGGTS